MTKNKQFKYIIPLALVATMVLAVMPVNAQTTYGLWPAQSEINSQGIVHFTSFVDQHDDFDVNSDDRIEWYNWWTNQYGGEYKVYPSYQYSGQSRSDMFEAGSLKYHEATDITTTIGAQQTNLYRYHKYGNTYTNNNLLSYLN